MDEINRQTWKTGQVFRQYRDLEGYVDPGEEAATEWLRAECRDQPILDLGVGCGRTTPLLRVISTDYIGIDYTKELLEVAARKHPGVAFHHMDARDLHAFADDSVKLVNFSFNAIDAVAFADRLKIIREAHRVLKPGGLFFFSAHNRVGPGTREGLHSLLPQLSANPVKLAWRVARSAAALPASLRNRWRFGAMRTEHEGYTVANASAHHFGLVILYTTLAEQKRQLAQAGFSTEVVFENTAGRAVSECDDLRDAWWLHFIARKKVQ